jgi:hypothetical protein
MPTNFDVSRNDYSGFDLSGYGFTSTSSFTNVNFTNAVLTNVDLSGKTLTGTTLINATLNGVNFSNANNVIGIFDNINANVGEKTLSTNGVTGIKLPPFCNIQINGNNLIYIPPVATTTNGDTNLSQSVINSGLSPDTTGRVTINTTQNTIDKLPTELKNNMGKLIPLNVLKLAIATGTIINIS